MPAKGVNHRLNALIIDPDLTSRSMLKELVHHEQSFGYAVYRGVYLAETLFDGLVRLSKRQDIDVVFISRNFSDEHVSVFIQSAKEKEGPHGVAYVLVATRDGESELSLATGIVGGGDGVVVAPCSVYDLREVTQIALRIKIEAQEKLTNAAIALMVSSLIDEIESRVTKYYQTSAPPSYKKSFKNAVQSLVNSSPAILEKYFDILAEKCAEMEPTVNAFYSGSSKRVRQRLLKRMRNSPSSKSSVTAEIIEALENGRLNIRTH